MAIAANSKIHIGKINRILLFVVSSTVVIIMFISLLSKNNYLGHQSLEKVTSPIPTVEEHLIDDVNDGVYFNYEYGFKFEYPEVIFPTRDGIREYRNGVLHRFRNDNELWLNVSILEGKDVLEEFEKTRNLEINQELFKKDYLSVNNKHEQPSQNQKKLRDLNLGG